MSKKDKLEPLADGFVAFHTESGERWKHRDVAEPDPGEAGAQRYARVFVSPSGEERRYRFGPKEPRDATIWDLRQQLASAQRADAAAGTPR
jgi:hypothetical protein